MNIEHTYAQALWKMISGHLPAGRQVDAKKAVSALRAALAKSGREALLPRIGRAFARISERESRKSRMVLSVARAKDARKAEKQIKSILKEAEASAEDVEVSVDETLVGGWRLEGREHLVDASYKKYLLDVYNRATR